MNWGGGLVPIRLAGADLDAIGVAAFAVLDCQGIAAYDHSYPVERVAVPPCGFARLEAQSPNEAGSALVKHLLDHGILRRIRQCRCGLPSGISRAPVNVSIQESLGGAAAGRCLASH
jgi:hypothetical protein